MKALFAFLAVLMLSLVGGCATTEYKPLSKASPTGSHMGQVSAHCNACGGSRNHERLHSEQREWEIESFDVRGINTYEMLKCAGCGEIKLRHTALADDETRTTTTLPQLTVQYQSGSNDCGRCYLRVSKFINFCTRSMLLSETACLHSRQWAYVHSSNT